MRIVGVQLQQEIDDGRAVMKIRSGVIQNGESVMILSVDIDDVMNGWREENVENIGVLVEIRGVMKSGSTVSRLDQIRIETETNEQFNEAFVMQMNR